jgi:hypothetical protein
VLSGAPLLGGEVMSYRVVPVLQLKKLSGVLIQQLHVRDCGRPL